MDIKALQIIYEELTSKLDSNPETAFEYYKIKWPKLTYEEKEVLKLFVVRYHNSVYQSDNIPLYKQMCLAEIVVDLALEMESRPVSQLKLTDKIKDIQLAKLFYDLKRLDYVNNTTEEIATVLASVFNLKFNTMFSYLSEPKRFEKIKPIF